MLFFFLSEYSGRGSSDKNNLLAENNIDPMVITIRTDAEQVLPSTSTRNTELASHNTPVGSVIQNQILEKILENQEKILSQLAYLQASVDFLMGVNMVKPTEQSVNRLPIQPLNSRNDFNELESKLKDETFYNKLVNELTFICGNSGKCKGVDSCYKLVDYFFTRQIFIHCNWTGSTRDSNAEKKIPFKYYSRIRKCFLDIIRKADISFTEHDADKFFKIVIKNAKPRLQNKVNSVARASKPRAKKQQIVNSRSIEQPQENTFINESPPQPMPNEEVVMNVPLPN